MKEILKKARVNVEVRDKETGDILFADHNLFVDKGRETIANIFVGTVSIDPTKFACDLGDSSQTPDVTDLDLVGFPPATATLQDTSIAITAGYPIILSGEATGVHFNFEFVNTGFGGDQTIRELGLFYRNAPLFPFRELDGTTGPMLARLKTTLSSIVVGDNRTITIDWKIIF